MIFEIDVFILVGIIVFFTSLNILLTLILFLLKKRQKKHHTTKNKLLKTIIPSLLKASQTGSPEQTDMKENRLFQGQYKESFKEKKELNLLKHKKEVFEVIKALSETVVFPEAMKEKPAALLKSLGYQTLLFKYLSSSSGHKRMGAAIWLPLFQDRETVQVLEKRLHHEPRYFIKLAIISGLVELKAFSSIESIAATLNNAPEWYRKKTVAIMQKYGYPLSFFVQSLITNDDCEGKEDLVITTSMNQPAALFETYLLDLLESPITELRNKALEALEKTYPHKLIDSKFRRHKYPTVQMAAFKAISRNPTLESTKILLEELKNKDTGNAAIESLKRAVYKKPEYLNNLVDVFRNETDLKIREALADVLADRIDYFIANISGKKRDIYKGLIKQICVMGKTSSLIGFLNRNKNINKEKELLDIIRELLGEKNRSTYINIYRDFAFYLHEEIAYKVGITEKPAPEQKKRTPLTKFDQGILILLAIGAAVFFPLIYVATSGIFGPLAQGNISIEGISIWEHIIRFIVQYNTYFIFYSAILNLSYLLLLVFSAWNLVRQLNFNRVKSYRFLYNNSVLPSISILAPAYNEEKSITQSVNALLNLKYPDYEVIVINDGSKDETLNTLIQYFKLEKTDHSFLSNISTAPLRGVFQNPSIPKLTVIDKENGGKADSLNAGINSAQNDYICTIDADSLLEPEALLSLMYQTTITDRETVALAGNILPVNGCTVKNGEIISINVPKKRLARFQTIEYMRAFLAGRLGWAFLNSLTIISGAFGTFKRSLVIQAGGYLTGRSIYKQDTVGEDMELVVRLHRQQKKKKNKYLIGYAFNANCWTEVPETMTVLYRQRDRWHRGLLEILSYHKQLFFRPKYGRIGLVAFPYFLFFEVVGPFFEFFGYAAFLLSALFGLLNIQIVLLLFITVILMGIFISIASLLISEHKILYFNNRETLIIIFYAFIENFGFRQLMGLIRFFAYITFLVKNKAWGEMTRTGFS